MLHETKKLLFFYLQKTSNESRKVEEEFRLCKKLHHDQTCRVNRRASIHFDI